MTEIGSNSYIKVDKFFVVRNIGTKTIKELK